MEKIEVEVKRYFAGFRYDGYSAKLPEGNIINFRISRNILDKSKPGSIKVTLRRDYVPFEELNG